MDMERIIGWLFSEFACKAYAIAAAIWVGSEVFHFIRHTAAMIGTAI